MEDTSKKEKGTTRTTTKSSGTTAKPTKRRAKPTPRPEAKPASLTEVHISVADDYLSRFGDVVGRVKKLGFESEQELPELGVIVGRMPAERVGELGLVEGVGFFERPGDRSYQLPPPESDLQ